MSAAAPGVSADRDVADSLYEPWEFLRLLDDLATTDLGISFVYSVLDVLAERFDLADATVVLTDDALGTQAFRLGRREADADLLDRVDGEPGLYAEPDVVPDLVRDAVRSICQLSLSLHLARYSAAHDALTSIANRRAFDAALHTAAVQSSRYGWTFSLILADLDELKSINDLSGHHAGDDALRLFGFALRRAVRAGDTAARIGGDEFAVILANAERPEVEAFLERLRATLLPGEGVRFSVGFATAPYESTDPAELFRIADGRLYENKGMIKR